MKKIFFIIFLFTNFYLVLTTSVCAVTTSINNAPTNISTDPFSIEITVAGASSGTNYLRIDLFKASTSNYFGETFNGVDWYKDTTFSQYYPVNIQSGVNWNGQIQARVGNPTSTQYDEPGNYKLRVRRYTSSGSYNTTEANNSAIDININIPIASPTPIIFPTETPTQIPSPTDAQIPNLDVSINPTEGTESPTPILGSDDPTPTYCKLQITPFSYNNIFLSEVMPNPPTGEKEWIEIFNKNDFPVSLTNWYIDDSENSGSTPKIFSLQINSKSYEVFDLSSSIFNNDGDTVRLLDTDKKLVDDFEYQKIETGKTLGRASFDTNDFCLQEPSKNLSNNSCINPTPTITPKCTGQTCLSPTENIIQTKNNQPAKIPISTNQETQPFRYLLPTIPNLLSSSVLGASDKIIINSPNQKPLINLLCSLGLIYSLLTILSILFRMKIPYGKNKKLYTSSIYSP
jgi:hypothetical protein